MYRNAGLVILALVTVLAMAAVAPAAPFEPLFQVKEISGTCQVKVPDSQDFKDAEDGKAYPYGTSVRTERKSSAVIVFSEGNQCRLMSGVTVTISQDAADAKLKDRKSVV